MADELRVAIVRGGLLAIGSEVERTVQGHAAACSVSEEARGRRRQRDGEAHHITLVAKPELSSMAPAQAEALAASAASSLRSGRVVPLGLGSAAGKEGTKCWFVAVAWPEVQALRVTAGLPRAHLHITVGFDGADVHGVAKGPLQLLPLPRAPAPREDWEAALALCRQGAAAPGAAAPEGGVAEQEAEALLERLLEEASLGAPAAVRADLLCSRCEMVGRRGGAGWEDDAAAALALDRTSGRAWLATARAHLAAARSAEAREALERAREWSERAGDARTGEAAERLRLRVQGATPRPMEHG